MCYFLWSSFSQIYYGCGYTGPRGAVISQLIDPGVPFLTVSLGGVVSLTHIVYVSATENHVVMKIGSKRPLSHTKKVNSIVDYLMAWIFTKMPATIDTSWLSIQSFVHLNGRDVYSEHVIHIGNVRIESAIMIRLPEDDID